MVLRPPLLSDHSDEYCRLVALIYQEGDDMTLTSIPDLTVGCFFSKAISGLCRAAGSSARLLAEPYVAL